MRPPATLAFALAVIAGGAACVPAPGFTADDAAAGPRVAIDANVDGDAAVLHVVAHELGDVLGVSAHVRVDTGAVAVDRAEASAFLGDEGARYVAHAQGGDVAVGGSHTSATSSSVADAAELAVIALHGVGAEASRVELVDAVARREDGSFVPLAVAGGSIVLEVKP